MNNRDIFAIVMGIIGIVACVFLITRCAETVHGPRLNQTAIERP